MIWPFKRKSIMQQIQETQDELLGKKARLAAAHAICAKATRLPGLIVNEMLDLPERIAVLELKLIRLEGKL